MKTLTVSLLGLTRPVVITTDQSGSFLLFCSFVREKDALKDRDCDVTTSFEMRFAVKSIELN